MKRPRVYADTSVFGGCFDIEFADERSAFFRLLEETKTILVISEVRLREIRDAPKTVKDFLAGLSEEHVERVYTTQEVENLANAYLDNGILPKGSLRDALHIAAASVAEVDLIVSWNFKHLVNFRRIRGFHAINLLNGYNAIPIHSPKAVMEL